MLENEIFDHCVLPHRRTLTDWIDLISAEGLPTLKNTIDLISKSNENNELSIEQLSEFIAQDPNLLANILRKTRGAYRKQSQNRLSTLKRAIELLGLNEIKALCLSLAIFEELNVKNNSEMFYAEVGITFHAAIQAKNLAFENREKNVEEIFTAALIFRIGNLAFWSLGGPSTIELSDLLKEESRPFPSKHEKIQLGFTLDELSKRLISNWGLNNYYYGTNAVCTNYLKLGIEIAENLTFGWKSPQVMNTIRKVARYLNISDEKAKRIIFDNYKFAVSHAKSYNIPRIAKELKKIPSGEKKIEKYLFKQEDNLHDSISNVVSNNEKVKCQSISLQNINKLTQENANRGELITTVIDCMHNCFAIDRVLYFEIDTKYLLTESHAPSFSDKKEDKFKIPAVDFELVNQIATGDKSIWLHPENCCRFEKFLSFEQASIIHESEAIILLLKEKNLPVGLFYLDRKIKHPSFQEEEFASLKHLIFQLELALEYLRNSQNSITQSSIK